MKTSPINPGDDLHAIREIMERSSKFLSLSGLSGVCAGICALIGAAVAWFFIFDSGQIHYSEYLRNPDSVTADISYHLVLDAVLVLVTAILGAFYFSFNRAKKSGQQFWNNSIRRLLIHLTIPLATGAIFILILMFRNNVELVASVMLVFYGLALVNAGKFTLGEIHYLGLTEIVLGILAAVFIDHGLLLWTIGFGLMHIIYGAVMYYRHEK